MVLNAEKLGIRVKVKRSKTGEGVVQDLPRLTPSNQRVLRLTNEL